MENLPASGSTSWYAWAQSIHSAVVDHESFLGDFDPVTDDDLAAAMETALAGYVTDAELFNALNSLTVASLTDVTETGEALMLADSPLELRAAASAAADDHTHPIADVDGLGTALAARPANWFGTLAAYNALSTAQKTNGTMYWTRP